MSPVIPPAFSDALFSCKPLEIAVILEIGRCLFNSIFFLIYCDPIHHCELEIQTDHYHLIFE